MVIWLRTILILRKQIRCCHIGYSFRLTARVLLYSPSHRQDSTYHGLCYTSRGALAGTRNSSMGSPHEGSIWRPITPWANALTTELHLAPLKITNFLFIIFQQVPRGCGDAERRVLSQHRPQHVLVVGVRAPAQEAGCREAWRC